MTEKAPTDIDRQAIQRRYSEGRPADWQDVNDVLAALDEARAERDDERRWRAETFEKLVIEGRVKNQAMDRAEAAEAALTICTENRDLVKARAEAAEARIAAALDLCDWTQHPDIPVAPYAFVDMVRAALTGDQDG